MSTRFIALIPQDPSMLNDKLLYLEDHPYQLFRQFLFSKDYEIHTIDKYKNIDQADILIVFDIPTLTLPQIKNKYYDQIKNFKGIKILVLFEAPVIIPQNWDKARHKLFNFVLTWNDDWVDNQKYFKFYWTQHNDAKKIKHPDFKARKLITLINANRTAVHKYELYTERRNAIDYLCKNYPNDFDLYGRGWSTQNKLSILMGINHILHLNLKYFRNLLQHYPTPICYRGQIEDKLEKLAQYRFAICYENMNHINGYITEKIWDCFKVGTIPIYLGAENVTDFIPSNCFIDKRKFKDYASLIRYVESINEPKFKQYQSNIFNFMKTQKAQVWFDLKWAENFGSMIIKLSNSR